MNITDMSSGRTFSKNIPSQPHRPVGVGEDKRPRNPYTSLRFFVEIDSIEVAGFTECSGLTAEVETMEYVEGGLNTATHKLPVRIKYGNVTLKRGINPGVDLYEWFKRCLDDGVPIRRNVSILIYGPIGEREVMRFNLMEAYPVKWTGPDLKTDAGATLVETLEFAHHGITPNTQSGIQ